MQPMNVMSGECLGAARAREDQRGVAGMEFAIVAPVMLLLIWGVWDLSRALLAWEETYHAAEAVAQAAEKLSVTAYTYKGGNQPVTALTAQQMQDAMSSIYAEIPWLTSSAGVGNGTGLFTGNYAVTLSGVAFNPLCVANKNNTCLPQTPTVLWSSYLTQGGSQLITPPTNQPLQQYRICGPLISVPQFPNDGTQLQKMINANLEPNGVANINLIPQVVADVQLQFQPSFPLLSGLSYTFYASATFPAPLGGDDQEIVFDQKDSAANTVENCPLGNPYNG